MAKDDGGPAFPRAYDALSFSKKENEGMSLRDWFAGMVLPTLCLPDFIKLDSGIPKNIVKAAYEIADTMLKERNRD